MAKVFILSVVGVIGLFWYPHWQEIFAQEQILRTTVQIAMIVPQLSEVENSEIDPLPIPTDEYRPIARPETYVVAEGLGTMVKLNGRSLLVTHDHWSQLAADLGVVQFRNATGTLLVQIDLYQFKRLILSHNGGLMVLMAPDVLAELAVKSGRSRGANGSTLLVHRQNGEVVVSPIQIVEAGLRDGVPVWRLQGQAIVSGDSGGGVWVDGQLAGVMWMAVMLTNPASPERQETDGSIAAVWQHGQP